MFLKLFSTTHLDLVDIGFKIVRTSMFAKVSRTYAASGCGLRLLENPFSANDLPQQGQTITKEEKKQKPVVDPTRGTVIISLISLQKSHSSKFILNIKEDYEYPSYSQPNIE